ncbi:MAG: hypothetical protein Fur005_20310 [Roseiflexaceae bacterium]
MVILVVWFFSLFAPLTTIVYCQVLDLRETAPILLTSAFVAHTSQHPHTLGKGAGCQQAQPSSTATSQWPPISSLPRILHDLLVWVVTFGVALSTCGWMVTIIVGRNRCTPLAPPTPPPRMLMSSSVGI